MRISLLKRREPVEEILTSTMSRFWRHKLGRETKTEWLSPARWCVSRRDWTCNDYVNAIFPPTADAAALEPVRREFSRSLVAWKRPLQRAYVQLATAPVTCQFFRHARIRFVPEIPDAHRFIIIPGNNKVRVLDHLAKTCTSILKTSGDAARLRTEVNARRMAEQAGVSVPGLIDYLPEEHILTEDYVCGTPLNRLASRTEQWEIAQVASDSLSGLHRSTLQEETAADYLDRVLARVRYCFDSPDLVADERLRPRLKSVADRLGMCLQEKARQIGSIQTAECHGDMQPANILVDGRQFWIIDWEHARRCQVGYDRLTLQSASRFPTGLAQRMAVEADGKDASLGLHLPRERRTWMCHLFWLEELAFHLSENCGVAQCQLNHGFLLFLTELEAWLEGDHRP